MVAAHLGDLRAA